MFFHHGDMCYWAMYGFEFIEKMVWVHEFVKNTKWEHTPAEWNTLAFLTYDGARNVIYRGNPEYSAGPKRASEMPLRIEWSVTGLKEIGEHILEYAQDDVAYKPEIINWLANYDITPGVMAEDDEKIELDEHKYFWNGDYQIHRRNGYYRITSYNVCYTKLLRCSGLISPSDLGEIFSNTTPFLLHTSIILRTTKSAVLYFCPSV